MYDFNFSESLGLQLKQKRKHNIYLRIFLNPILRGESYNAFMHNIYVKMLRKSLMSSLLKPIDIKLNI